MNATMDDIMSLPNNHAPILSSNTMIAALAHAGRPGGTARPTHATEEVLAVHSGVGLPRSFHQTTDVAGATAATLVRRLPGDTRVRQASAKSLD